MKKLLFTTALACTFFGLPCAWADEKDDRIMALEQQLQMLAAEVQALKEERNAEKEEIAAFKSSVEKQAADIAASIAPAAGAGSKDEVKVTMKPSPKFEYGDFSFQPFGRIHLDAAIFNDDVADHPDGAEFRRARLGVKGSVAEEIGYKLEIDFANEGVAFKDVYMNYTGFGDTEVRLGHFKPPMGLEEMTSSNYITFIERSAPTQAFATGEIIGIGAFSGGDNWSLAGGLFNDDAGVGSADDEAWSIAARGTFAPVLDADTTLHFGGSAAYREPDQANERFDFDARAENAIQSMDSVSANFANAEDAAIYGVEAAFVQGPFSVQGEYFFADVDRDGANSDLDFGGAYVQAAWTLTGERRPYDAGAGKFGRIVPDQPLDPSQGHWGAWELAGRYSTIDVSDDNVSGGEMDNYTLGLNWYIHKHARFMMNYIDVDTDSGAVSANDDPQIVLFRGQIDF